MALVSQSAPWELDTKLKAHKPIVPCQVVTCQAPPSNKRLTQNLHYHQRHCQIKA